MEKGEFIVLEGQGLSGKTVQAKLLAERLEGQGLSVVKTRHPGGTPSAEVLRAELLKRKKEDPNFSPDDEFQLMSKCLFLLEDEVVKPAVDSGSWVVSDRYWASLEMYQGFEAGFDLSTIRQAKAERLAPRLYVYLSVAPDEILNRINRVAGERELHAYNQPDLRMIQNRHRYYQRIMQSDKSQRWASVNGTGSIDEVSEHIWQTVNNEFKINT